MTAVGGLTIYPYCPSSNWYQNLLTGILYFWLGCGKEEVIWMKYCIDKVSKEIRFNNIL